MFSLLKFKPRESSAEAVLSQLLEVERTDDISIEVFRELIQSVLRIAKKDFHRSAFLGIQQINAAQDAIVQNLLTTVMQNQRFLVVDVGAHEGWFLDRLVSSQELLKVIAFEPNPGMFLKLKESKQAFEDLEIIPKAVGDAPGELSLRVYSQCDGLSSLLPFERGYHYLGEWFDDKEFQSVVVEVIRLDDYFSENAQLAEFEQVVLKIDVQGFEDRVLAGAEQLLSSGRVKAILIELVTESKYEGSADLLKLLNQLDRLGFVVYDINPFYREREHIFQELPLGRLTELDCLLVHRDYMSQVSGCVSQ